MVCSGAIIWTTVQIRSAVQELHGKPTVMLTRNVKHDDPIKGLEVRWHLVSQILQALVARPRLYPHMRDTRGYAPWRVGENVDEHMHLWYYRRHGMFDLLEEAQMKARYAPKVARVDDEYMLLGPEDVATRVAAGDEVKSVDVRTPAEMLTSLA